MNKSMTSDQGNEAYSPLVSIVTIVYNGERYIEHAIQSVINQSYRNIQYIVIDGGSKDNTLSIIKKYSDRIAIIVSEKDEGISDAFNKGLVRATGDMVGILNSDDWFANDAVEKVVRNIGDADVVYGDLQLWKGVSKDFIVKGTHGYLENEMSINHPTVFVRRSAYEKFGLFDKRYKCAMDYDLLLRLKLRGCKFRYIPEVLANMRWGGTSDTGWMVGCREVRQIKNKYLPRRKWKNNLYFVKQVSAIALAKFLGKMKLNGIVRFYRSRFSKIRKVY